MELNNRELAIVIWFFVALGFVGFNQKMQNVRNSLNGVLVTFISRPILMIVGFMMIYVAAVVYGLSILNLWDYSQVKNTLIWFVSTAFISMFNLDKYQEEKHFYKEFYLSNFKLIAIIQFVLGIYTFNLVAELVLVPALIFLSGMLVVAKRNREHHAVASLLTNILSLYGLVLISYALYMIVSDFNGFASKATVHDFLIPSLLTICYLPFVIFLLIYSTYERIFVRLQFSIKNPELLRYTKYYVLTRFNFRFRNVVRWSRSLGYLKIESRADIRKSVHEIFKLIEIEKNPPQINTNRGWSPYDALEFLSEVGIVAENYHPTYNDEWVGQSKYIKTTEDYQTQNKVNYYVNGNANIADSLELNFAMSSLETINIGHVQLLEYARILVNNALDRDIPTEIEYAIITGVASTVQVGFYEVTLSKDVWGNKSLGGYDLELRIELSKSKDGK